MPHGARQVTRSVPLDKIFNWAQILNHEKFLGHCILETLSAIHFTDIDVIAVEDKSLGLCFP